MTSPRLLLVVISKLDYKLAQLRLNNAQDKDLALVLSHMADIDRELILARVSEAKTHRLRDHMQRLKHVRYSPDAYELALKSLVLHMESQKPLPGMKSYFRPPGSG